jgi:hypothetical protein
LLLPRRIPIFAAKNNKFSNRRQRGSVWQITHSSNRHCVCNASFHWIKFDRFRGYTILRSGRFRSPIYFNLINLARSVPSSNNYL